MYREPPCTPDGPLKPTFFVVLFVLIEMKHVAIVGKCSEDRKIQNGHYPKRYIL